jgi:hypothetical protein
MPEEPIEPRIFSLSKPRKKQRVFNLHFRGTVRLSEDQIWPDGDGPENPRSKDITNLIENTYSNMGDLITDWSLEKEIHCIISSSESDVETLTL